MGSLIISHFVSSLRETFPTRASEWAMGTILFLWSVLMALDPMLLSSSRLSGLLSLMDQDSWALLALSVGGGRLLILGINGSWRRSPHLRATAAFISCFFWFHLTISIIQLHDLVTALAFYPVLFLLDVYNVFRASGDAGKSDRIHTGAQHGTDT